MDGHLNAVERVSVAAPESLRTELLRRASPRTACSSACGAPTRGPRRASRRGSRAAGPSGAWKASKTFCSGAGGLDGALVVAGAPEGRMLVHVDLRAAVEVDRTWFGA